MEKRDQANGAEEREVNAGKVPAGAREMIELDVLADPADVECHQLMRNISGRGDSATEVASRNQGVKD